MSEQLVSDRLIRLLEPQFWVVPEVWLRDPIGGAHLRVDFVAMPRNPEALPFEFIAFETKANGVTGSDYVQAFKQCIDYKRCVIDDDRAKRAFGMFPTAVFLFRGDTQRRGLHDAKQRDPARYALVRLAGKFNVGDAFDDPIAGLTLLISDEVVWTATRGLTGKGRRWPTTRRVGNSSRRAA
jgi:hypothetical protein